MVNCFDFIFKCIKTMGFSCFGWLMTNQQILHQLIMLTAKRDSISVDINKCNTMLNKHIQRELLKQKKLQSARESQILKSNQIKYLKDRA